MKDSITEKLLLFLADMFDANQSIMGIKGFQSFLSGNPHYHKNYLWMTRYLENRKKRKKLHNAFHSLVRRGLLKKKISNGTIGYALSEKAQEKILRLQLLSQRDTKSKLKRGECLMIFFDIPEVLRKKRDALRFCLCQLGCEKLQKSIWITPYNIHKEIKAVLTRLGVSQYTEILEVRRLKEK